MTHPKADGLDTLKREEMFHQFMDVLDETNIPNLYAVMAASTLADHLAQRGMLLPDGWVAVPREPTSEMIKSGYECDFPLCPDIYRAMLAAAPKGNNNDKN